MHFSPRTALLSFALALAALLRPAVAAEPPPNILILLADDLGYNDLSCQGSPDIRTPRIDALAASGLRFTSGYVTAPQCSPSRAGLLTGMNQARFGFLDNGHHRGLPPPSVAPTIAAVLKDAGYATGMIGKWHVELPEYNRKVAPADRPANGVPLPFGFDSFVMIEGGGSHYFPYSPAGIKKMHEEGREPRLYEASPGTPPHYIETLPPETYLTDYFSGRAVDYITQNRNRPWFLYVAYNAPHTPLQAPEADLAANNHIDSKPRRTFAGMMTALDRGIGRIVDALETSGQRGRTLVFFISDNGGPTKVSTSRNDPLRGLKGDVFEGGIRVPFIASWPGALPSGVVFEDPVSTLDLMPTLATLAGRPVPAQADGLDLIPALTSGKTSGTALAGRTLRWRWRNNFLAIRSGSVKQVRNGGNGGGFFDLEQNLSEADDAQIANPVVRKTLSDTLDAWNSRVNREMENPNGG